MSDHDRAALLADCLDATTLRQYAPCSRAEVEGARKFAAFLSHRAQLQREREQQPPR
jgi:hypothetical protein